MGIRLGEIAARLLLQSPKRTPALPPAASPPLRPSPPVRFELCGVQRYGSFWRCLLLGYPKPAHVLNLEAVRSRMAFFRLDYSVTIALTHLHHLSISAESQIVKKGVFSQRFVMRGQMTFRICKHFDYRWLGPSWKRFGRRDRTFAPLFCGSQLSLTSSLLKPFSNREAGPELNAS